MEQAREGGGLEAPKAAPVLDLRSTARLHDIERRLRTVRFTSLVAKWIGAPVLVGAGLFIVYVLLRASAGLSPSLLVPFSVSLVAPLLLLRSSWKNLRTEEKRLRAERTALAAGAGQVGFRVEAPIRP